MQYLLFLKNKDFYIDIYKKKKKDIIKNIIRVNNGKVTPKINKDTIVIRGDKCSIKCNNCINYTESEFYKTILS